jgi:hypothetical protein
MTHYNDILGALPVKAVGFILRKTLGNDLRAINNIYMRR